MFKFFHASPKDESVYKLVETESEKNEERERSRVRRRYRSVHSELVRREVAESKAWPAKTMGVPHIQVEEPSAFLKKNSKRPLSLRPSSVPCKLPLDKGVQAGQDEDEESKSKTENVQANTSIKVDPIKNKIRPKTCSRVCMTPKKPPIPRGPLEVIVRDGKDFIKSNAVKMMEAPAKNRTQRYVDTNTGLTKEWLNSGLAPQYIHRKNFGQVPKYLVKRRNELMEKQKMAENEKKEKPRVQKLDEVEREKLIYGLKENWNQVFTLYQSLPLLIDTPGKIRRKLHLELQLKKIEKDLQTLQRHEAIYVADVERPFYFSSRRY